MKTHEMLRTRYAIIVCMYVYDCKPIIRMNEFLLHELLYNIIHPLVAPNCCSSSFSSSFPLFFPSSFIPFYLFPLCPFFTHSSFFLSYFLLVSFSLSIILSCFWLVVFYSFYSFLSLICFFFYFLLFAFLFTSLFPFSL